MMLEGIWILSNLKGVGMMVSIYFATKDKIYKAAGEEDRWTLETIEGPEEIRSIAFDEISNRLFAGTFNDGLHGSDDDGESWQWLGEDALNKRVMSIAVSKTEQLGEVRSEERRVGE